MKTMKIISILCLLVLSASTCKKEGVDCHYNISIINNSSSEIIFAIPIKNPDGKCKLDGKTITKGETYNYRPYNFCIEESLNYNSSLEIYIVDPSQYNDPYIYYNCDSIEIKNKVLKHYVLTLDELKRINFMVTYP